MAGEKENTGYQQETGDQLAKKSFDVVTRERKGGAITYAGTLAAPQQEWEGADDTTDQLGYDKTYRMPCGHSFFQSEGQADDGIDVSAADPADGGQGDQAAGRAKQEAGEGSSEAG